MRHSSLFDRISEAKTFLEGRLSRRPETALVFGSGLAKAFLKEVKIISQTSFEEIPFFQRATVKGHGGSLYEADLQGHGLLISDGRLHYYEGYTMSEVVFPIRVYSALGIKEAIFTNASGGLNPRFKAGGLMVVKDHINLRGPNDERLGPRFVDMGEAYDAQMLKGLFAAARRLEIPLQKGVYVGIMGPCYETPAEIALYRKMGGDAVGMSTVPEVIAARHLGLPIAVVSCVTNLLKPRGNSKVSHDQVVERAKKSQEKLAGLLKEFLCAQS